MVGEFQQGSHRLNTNQIKKYFPHSFYCEIAGIFADERERIENIEANMNERVTTAYDLGYNDGWNAAFNTIKEKFGDGRRE